MARLLGRKEGGGIDVDSEQIAHGVLVFGASQSSKGAGASGIGMFFGVSVDRGFDRVGKPVILSVAGAFAIEWGHLACAELACGFLPDCDLGREVSKKSFFKVGVPFAVGALVAVEAVFFQLGKPLFLWCGGGGSD